VRILTFDIEDWFHIEFKSNPDTWIKHQPRIEKNLEMIFSLLKEREQPATFFCLGWIAEKYPGLIRKIDSLGYEIGSHSYDHKLVYQKTPEEFEEDLKKSIFSIEGAVGKKVTSFRAPAFSVNQKTLWFFELLHKYGIETDASVFPGKRDFGGFSEFSPARPVIIDYQGIKLKEFPVNIYNFMTKRFVFSGGGYFRLLPYYIIRKLAISSEYMMVYLHPRDIDPDQPVLDGLSSIRKFKSYVGLENCYTKIDKLLTEFKFNNLSGAVNIIDWQKTETVYLK
jgi:polysaccharide deacetylase family protein (PEP-CTERM system associated)